MNEDNKESIENDLANTSNRLEEKNSFIGCVECSWSMTFEINSAFANLFPFFMSFH